MDQGRILVVEDDYDVNQLIKVSLQKENLTVDSAYDGETAERLLTSNSYDLVILDIMIPNIDGLELLTRLRKTMQMPVIILSAKVEETDKIIGLGLGADDYMTKPFSIGELKARVKAHLRRHFYSHEDIKTEDQSENRLQHGNLQLNLDSYQCSVEGKFYALKAKEFEILKLFLSHPKKVFTKSQIYESVWQDDYMTDENTVMVHIRRLRLKIEKDPSNPKIIQTVWGIGYKLGEDI